MSRAAFDGGKTAAGWMLQSSSKFPVWIIEHVWAHKMMDVKDVIDPSSWPDVDSQPLSLEDSWRLRVVSAQVYSIIKNRDVRNFERVVGFLETTYRLLPRLVPAIKHMKVVFGLKTMVIMWMLKDDKGVIDIVSKVGQFFPNKLPQYQDQCSQRTMFLMRKNHLDFKSLAQTLAMNKDRLEDYIKVTDHPLLWPPDSGPLPLSLRSLDSVVSFKKQLKTHLFMLASSPPSPYSALIPPFPGSIGFPLS